MTTGASWFACRKALLLALALMAAEDGGKAALSELQVSTDGQQVSVSTRLENASSSA